MLALTRYPTDGALCAKNCLVLVMPDGSRVRVWLAQSRGSGKMRVLVDAPESIRVLRGELVGAEADGPLLAEGGGR